MTKLKKVTALLLLALLVTQLSYSQSPIKSKPTMQGEFKINLTKPVYEKSEVEHIIKIVLSESNKSIDDAFAEGYKQGLLAAAPDAEYYKTLSAELEKEVKRLSSPARVPWWSIPLSIAGGSVLGYGLAQIRR